MSDVLSQIVDLDNQIDDLVECWYDKFIDNWINSDDLTPSKLEAKWNRAIESHSPSVIKIPFFLKHGDKACKEKYLELVQCRSELENLYMS